MSELICPNCGSKVVLPEHEHLTMGIALAKDSDNNKYYLNMEANNNTTNTKENTTMGKITERLNELKNNGVDTSKYFAMTAPNGQEMLMKWEGLTPMSVSESELDAFDEIEEEIYANGYVKNTKLHRRWVMAQMFQALNHKAYRWTDHLGRQRVIGRDGYYGWLEEHGYRYQWKTVLEECRVLSQIEGVDAEAFAERSMFFTKDVIVEMLFDYKAKVLKMVDKLPTHKCKGIDYKRVPHFGDVFCVDINKKIAHPIDKIIIRIQKADSYRMMYFILERFLGKWGEYIELGFNTKMSNVFIDAYKGTGAYYTLKNMVLFHNVEIIDYYTGEVLTGKNAYRYIQRMNIEYKGEGYKMFALLKKTIEDNHFDFEKSIAE